MKWVDRAASDKSQQSGAARPLIVFQPEFQLQIIGRLIEKAMVAGDAIDCQCTNFITGRNAGGYRLCRVIA
jgi:hypothetical protein